MWNPVRERDPGGTRCYQDRVPAGSIFRKEFCNRGSCGYPAGPSFPRQNARAGPCGSPFLWVLHHTPFGFYNVNQEEVGDAWGGPGRMETLPLTL